MNSLTVKCVQDCPPLRTTTPSHQFVWFYENIYSLYKIMDLLPVSYKALFITLVWITIFSDSWLRPLLRFNWIVLINSENFFRPQCTIPWKQIRKKDNISQEGYRIGAILYNGRCILGYNDFNNLVLPGLWRLQYFKFILFIEPKYCIHISDNTIFIIFFVMSVGTNC